MIGFYTSISEIFFRVPYKGKYTPEAYLDKVN